MSSLAQATTAYQLVFWHSVAAAIVFTFGPSGEIDDDRSMFVGRFTHWDVGHLGHGYQCTMQPLSLDRLCECGSEK